MKNRFSPFLNDDERTDKQTNVIKAITDLMTSASDLSSGLNDTRRAIATALDSFIFKEFEKTRGVEKSLGASDIWSIYGESDPFQSNQPPGRDHENVFIRDKKFMVYTMQPYGIQYEALKELIDYCEKNGFRADISAESWHFPGRTILIELKPVELEKIKEITFYHWLEEQSEREDEVSSFYSDYVSRDSDAPTRSNTYDAWKDSLRDKKVEKAFKKAWDEYNNFLKY